jgi:K(+)-stimulated pyrophosphate-energized sodium pump
MIVSMDTFGPVSDNAQGIAEMSGDFEGEAAQVLTRLDAVGNTTKAITKGIAIATAVLAATALFGAFRTTVESALGHAAGTFSLSIDRPNALVGLIVGAAVVFLFLGAGDHGRGPGGIRGARAVPDPPGDHELHREA